MQKMKHDMLRMMKEERGCIKVWDEYTGEGPEEVGM
jgi:hypothetical protein